MKKINWKSVWKMIVWVFGFMQSALKSVWKMIVWVFGFMQSALKSVWKMIVWVFGFMQSALKSVWKMIVWVFGFMQSALKSVWKMIVWVFGFMQSAWKAIAWTLGLLILYFCINKYLLGGTMDFTWIAVISLVILVLIALLVADYLFNGFKVTKKAIGWTPQLMNFRLGKVVWFIIICLFLFTPLWPQYLWPQIKWAWSSKDPEQRMWSTGFVNREGEEEWKLAITNKEDYLFELPKCTKFRFCNPHRVQKYYPNARSSGNPDAIEREVLYTDYEVSRGVGTYVDHKGVISYMNYFYMTPDPSVTDISKDTVTVWMKYKGELTNR